MKSLRPTPHPPARSKGVDWQPVEGSGQRPRCCSQGERDRSGWRPGALEKCRSERDAAPQEPPELHSDASGWRSDAAAVPRVKRCPCPCKTFTRCSRERAGQQATDDRKSDCPPSLLSAISGKRQREGEGGMFPNSDACFQPPELYRRPVCWPHLFVVSDGHISSPWQHASPHSTDWETEAEGGTKIPQTARRYRSSKHRGYSIQDLGAFNLLRTRAWGTGLAPFPERA